VRDDVVHLARDPCLLLRDGLPRPGLVLAVHLGRPLLGQPGTGPAERDTVPEHDGRHDRHQIDVVLVVGQGRPAHDRSDGEAGDVGRRRQAADQRAVGHGHGVQGDEHAQGQRLRQMPEHLEDEGRRRADRQDRHGRQPAEDQRHRACQHQQEVGRARQPPRRVTGQRQFEVVLEGHARADEQQERDEERDPQVATERGPLLESICRHLLRTLRLQGEGDST
jgi:hypothetical protein